MDIIPFQGYFIQVPNIITRFFQMEFIFRILHLLSLCSCQQMIVTYFLPFTDGLKKTALESALFDAFVYTQQIAGIKSSTTCLDPFNIFRSISLFQFKPTQHTRHQVTFEITLVLQTVIDLAFTQIIVPRLSPVHERIDMPPIMEW